MRGFLVRTFRNLALAALFVGLGAGVGAGQQAGSAAETAAAPARIYDEGSDVVAPELLPMERTIPDPSACTRESDDEIALSLIVDANGRPRDVTVMSPKGAPVERLAIRIVEEDSFKPGMLKGEPVEVRLLAHVSIEGCYATKKDAAGNSTEVFRLKAQPVQTFGAKPKEEEPVTQLTRIDASPDTSGLYKIVNGVSAPVPLNDVKAEFSDEARRKHIEGVCLVTLIVDTHGNPVNLRVARALGYGLDQKALEAVRKYHFKPAMKGKVPVPVMITVEVNFRL
jgi:TonB family protein